MIWIISGVVLGLILGVVGYYFSKAAYSLFVAFMGGFGIYSYSAVDYAGGATGNMSEFRLLGLIFKTVDNMGLLPEHIQLAVILFVVTFFLARIITWFLTKMNIKPDKVETKLERKNRILKQYGYTDGMPY